MMVWAFGDGDYGKLGLGNSTAKSSPQVGTVEGVHLEQCFPGSAFCLAPVYLEKELGVEGGYESLI